MSNSYWYGFAIGSGGVGGVLGAALVSVMTVILTRRLRAKRTS